MVPGTGNPGVLTPDTRALFPVFESAGSRVIAPGLDMPGREVGGGIVGKV